MKTKCRTKWSHRLPSQGLPDHGINVRKVRSIVELRETALKNRVEFYLGFLLDLWMKTHGHEKRLYGGNGLKTNELSIKGNERVLYRVSTT